MSSEESRRVLSPRSDEVPRSRSKSYDPLFSANATSRSKEEGKLTTARFRDDFLLDVDREVRILLVESSSDNPESRTASLRLIDATGVRAADLFKTIRVGIFYKI